MVEDHKNIRMQQAVEKTKVRQKIRLMDDCYAAHN
jgi:hypothetical protein